MKTARIIALTLLFFVALSSLVAGYLFITDPSGAALHIPVRWLLHSPFDDFFIPGIILFIVNGVLSLLAAACTIWRIRTYPRMVSLQGILLTGWIVVQIIMLQQLLLLHLIYGGIGILLFILGIKLKSNHHR
ncbi:MAG: hypothetical protein JWO09_1380 [Bacteroidetes bacterium]|nr:hypothetical protein [Bacteroidota bacterium]